MKKLMDLQQNLYSYNTVYYKDKLFNFVANRSELTITELSLESASTRRTNRVTVSRPVTCVSCCSFGDEILLLGELKAESGFLCALVTIDSNEWGTPYVRLKERVVTGLEEHEGTIFLAHFLKNNVWVSFVNSDEVWIGELIGGELAMTNYSTHQPVARGLSAPPLRLPEGTLLLAGGNPLTNRLVLVSKVHPIWTSRIGVIPGEGRYCVSTVLVKERFVVGFGGLASKAIDEMWILDLVTHETASVKKAGQWHPAAYWSVLTVNEDTLYIIGGRDALSIHSLPLSSLLDLIQDPRIRSAFLITLMAVACPSAAHLSELQTLVDQSFSLQADLRSAKEENSQLAATLEQERSTAQRRVLPVWARDRLAYQHYRDDYDLRWYEGDYQESEEGQSPICIHLPFKNLPYIIFPRGCLLEAFELRKLLTSMDMHERSLPRKISFIREYQTAFLPLLGEGLIKTISRARGAICHLTILCRVIFELSVSLSPGELFPNKESMRTLARSVPLRPDWKLMDSFAAKTALTIFQGKLQPRESVITFVPPSYGAIISLLSSHDPLCSEARHYSTGRLRKALKFARVIERADDSCGLEEPISLFQKARALMIQGLGGPNEDARCRPWPYPAEASVEENSPSSLEE